MTDKEIIKAVERCLSGKEELCKECPLNEKCYGDVDYLLESLDIINRQQEQLEATIAGQETLQKALAEKDREVERLTAEKEQLIKTFGECQTEAARVLVEKDKEIERLKNELFCLANERDSIASRNGTGELKMRDYLFRGKRIDNGEWVEGCGIIATENWVSIFTVIDDIDENSSEVNEIEVLPETVGQYTGKTDKNAKKIFEGDVVDILTENEEVGIITYGSACFYVKADGFSVDFRNNIDGEDLLVIGNIHDNPELLRGGDGNA